MYCRAPSFPCCNIHLHCTQLAEKKYYNVVEIYEEVLEHVLEKLGTIEKAKKENEVFDKVHAEMCGFRVAGWVAFLKCKSVIRCKGSSSQMSIVRGF